MIEFPRPLLLFDGLCGLCSRSVQFVAKRDRHKRIYFTSLQSEVGHAILAEYCFEEDITPETMILIDDQGLHVRSTAAIRVARLLGPPYSLLAAVVVIVPRPLRDWAYNLIARNRYRWFGKRDSCMAPDSSVQDRFVERG